MSTGSVSVELLREMAADDVTGRGWETLVNMVDHADTFQRLVDVVLVRAMLDIEAQGLSVEHTGKKPVNWLSGKTGRSPGEVASLLHCARTLQKWLPEIFGVWMASGMSTDQAKVFSRAVNSRNAEMMAKNQDRLLGIMGSTTSFEAFQKNISSIGKLFDPDGGHKPEPDGSWVKFNALGDGMSISGHLTGADAEVVAHALGRETERIFRNAARDERQCRDLPVGSLNELRARALAGICQRYGSKPHLRRFPEVTLVARTDDDHPVFDDGFEGLSPTMWRIYRQLDGKELTPDQYSVFLCDAKISLLVTDGKGGIRKLTGHDQSIPDALRKALHIRDGGCVFPGCDAPALWTDGHHVHHYAKQGPTESANIALLCRHHHGVVHRKGWRMIHLPNERFAIITPTGELLICQRHGRIVDVSDLTPAQLREDCYHHRRQTCP